MTDLLGVSKGLVTDARCLMVLTWSASCLGLHVRFLYRNLL